jgi:hypothetical protein
MAISTLCPGCQSLFRFPDELAGKPVRCQKCGRPLMVPGVLVSAPPPVPPPAPKRAPRSEPVPPAPPAVTISQPPRAEQPPPAESVPSVVLVEVPVKPAPPPLPEDGEPAAPRQAEPPAPPRRVTPSTPPPLMGGRERPRRVNRSRNPKSTLAGVALALMALLFVGLLGASGITWLVTAISGARPGFVQQKQPQPFIIFGGPGGNLGGGAPNGPFLNPGPPGPKFDDTRAIKVELKNGAFHGRTLLTDGDPRDQAPRVAENIGGPPVPVPPLPCKAFLVELEKGKKYTFEYKRLPPISNQFDPYLRIEDEGGQRLIEFDDIIQGQDLDSRIDGWSPPKTGTYRVICTLYQKPLQQQPGFLAPDALPPRWDFTLSIREAGAVLPPARPVLTANVALPKPQAADRALPTLKTTEGDLSVTTLTNLTGANAAVKGDVCWSADGKAFFVLAGTGTLLRVALDGFVEQRRLDLGKAADRMAMSGQGLVVTLPSLGEAWLINPETLEVRKRYGVLSWSAPMAVTSAPGLDRAVVCAPPSNHPEGAPFANQFPGNPPMPLNRGLVVLDLAGDEPPRFWPTLPNRSPAITPDGNLLFTMDGDVLTRFRVKAGGELAEEQKSPKLGPGNFARIDVSPDGKLVCAAGSTAKTLQLPDHPGVGQSPVFVYPVTNLRKPAFGFPTLKPAHAVGIDPQAERVFTSASGKPLAVFGFDGKKLAGFDLANTGPAEEPQQYLVHPEGNRVLIRFATRLCLAAFKGALNVPVAQAADPNVPAPAEVRDGEPVALAAVKRGPLALRELRLPNLGEVDPCWDAAGEAVLHLDADGNLTRYRAADGAPQVQLGLGRPAAAMALSEAGLLVALAQQPEVWVIDPQSLQVRRRIVCPGPAKYLAARPGLAVAVAVGAEVALLDARAGRVLARGVQGGPGGPGYQNPALAADGKYLFLAQAGAGTSRVVRVRIEPERLVAEEAKATAALGAHAFCVTADGRFVAWYSPALKGKRAEVEFYPAGEWKAAAFSLAVRPRVLAAGPDGAVYAQAHELEVVRFAQAAPAQAGAAAEAVPWQEGRLRELAPHPRRPGVFLASTGTRAFLAEIAAK